MTMTYKRFRKLPELEGYKLVRETSSNTYFLKDTNNEVIAFFNDDDEIFSNDYEAMLNMSAVRRLLIIKALFELMMTPPNEREEPKSYYIHRVPELGEDGYLSSIDGYLEVGRKNPMESERQTKFTMEEVRKLEAKYDEDYSGTLEEAEED